jgi:riboflavin kinase/FMN adenylyltransferase
LTLFSITGTVIHGNHLGRTLGYPTANISFAEETVWVERTGVYAVFILVKGRRYQGMANIGFRPTIQKNGFSVEVNIFDFSADIYGETVSVDFAVRLRDEIKFNSLDELVRQMDLDMIMARKMLSEGL